MMRMFPHPEAGEPGARIFRAPRLWEFNVCGAAVAGIAGAAFLLVVAVTLIWLTGTVTWVPLLLILNVAVGTLVIFRPGNFLAAYPYAAEIVPGEGVRFCAPLNSLYVPIEEVERVEWSYLRTGWVVRLRKRRGLVSRLVIHVAWGSRGRDLARALAEELGRRRAAS